MPSLTATRIGLAFSVHGCPNRCRHCFVGLPSRLKVTEQDLRRVVGQFRSLRSSPGAPPRFQQLRVATWAWEPDFSPDYRRLYKLENELADLPSPRPEMEVLSIWRLAHDPDYAAWANSIGVRVCQISFHGLEKATDWGFRRRGAFRDALLATERLLASGIRPRWQWFLTRHLLPDLPGLIALTEDLRLKQRCEDLGGAFTLCVHCPWPDGEAWRLESLRPTIRCLEQLPPWLREQSERHLGGSLGQPEGRLVREMRDDDRPVAGTAEDLAGNAIWFYVLGNLDVYSNVWNTMPAWRLGNLETDGLPAIIEAFEDDRPAGFRAAYHIPVAVLARRYGRPGGRRLYAPDDLKARWVRMYLDDTA